MSIEARLPVSIPVQSTVTARGRAVQIDLDMPTCSYSPALMLHLLRGANILFQFPTRVEHGIRFRGNGTRPAYVLTLQREEGYTAASIIGKSVEDVEDLVGVVADYAYQCHSVSTAPQESYEAAALSLFP